MANAIENGNEEDSCDSYTGNSEENAEIFLPINIFNNEVSSLESISKYLKETVGLRYCKIADLLNRDDRTIWGAYNSAKEKSGIESAPEGSRINIPLSIFKDRSLSVLEALAEYLKEDLNLRYCRIADLLNKDQRTIWTVYNRAKKKRKGYFHETN